MPDLSQTVAWLRTHGVIFTLAVFTLLIVITYWPGRQKTLQRHGAIPLNDDPWTEDGP